MSADDILDRIDDVLGQGLLDGSTVAWDAVSGPVEPEDDDDLELAEWERELLIAHSARVVHGSTPRYYGLDVGESRILNQPPQRPVIRLLAELGVLPVLERIVLALNRLITRSWFRRWAPFHPMPAIDAEALRMVRGMRTVTVHLTADISGFMDAMDRAGVSAERAGAGFRILARQILERRSRDEMRTEGQAQLQAARLWLSHHVDGVYADLKLTRPQEEHTQ